MTKQQIIQRLWTLDEYIQAGGPEAAIARRRYDELVLKLERTKMPLDQDLQEDVDFLTQTIRWHSWPFCPVKKAGVPGEFPQVATCYDAGNDRKIVYLCNMLSVAAKEFTLKDAEKIEYANSYDMVQDGWRVD